MCGAMLAGGLASCDKEKENEKTDPKPSFKLALTNAEDANIVLNHDQEDVFYVGITTDAPVEKIDVQEKNGETWCDAVVYKADSIRVTPGANTSETDKSATFVVSINGDDKVAPVEFTVIRRGTTTEYTVSISGEGIIEDEYGMLKFTPAYDTETKLTVTVTTNAARWFLSDFNQVFDDEYNPIEWYTFDKTSGRSGETVTVTFTPNTGVNERMASLTFKYDENSYDALYLTVMQPAKPATAVSFMDENGEPIEAGEYEVAFGKDDAGFMGSLTFEMTKDGSVDFVVCQTGTTTPVGDDSWLNVSMSYDGSGLDIVPTANATGAERSADVVVMAGGSETVLFRFKVTQAGA